MTADRIERRPGRSTLVEFTLAPDRDGTLLKVVESGFASLDVSPNQRATKLAGNTEGWQIEIGHLVDYLARSPAVR